MKAKISILSLTYSITFNDSDNGRCYAGDGQRIVSVHRNRADAEAIAKEYNPIIIQAEAETVVFPVQKFNRILKNRFGFTLSDIGQDEEHFKLTVETYEVEE